MARKRKERDSLGEVWVPADALYGAQTQRAIDNFPVSGQPMPEAFIRSLLDVKAAAAKANGEVGALPKLMVASIVSACDKLLESASLMQHFPVDVFQTGSGTSTNMNANEVIAELASGILSSTVNPNDHVNCSQSSNDVIPTTIHVSVAREINSQLLPALAHLVEVIDQKGKTVKQYCKTGRTHLMDAMPVTMAQSLSGWSAQVRQNSENLTQRMPNLLQLAQGGTAVGTGVNADPDFAASFCRFLNERTKLQFLPASNRYALISSQNTAIELSGELKAIAVSILKIANDLRWMNSGPLAGLGEITLESLQPGSSIMPGKVNPVIPEAAAMAAAQVIGNDTAITIGGQSGNFELNVMLPMIARNLLESITLLSNSARLLADKAIAGFTVNEQRLQESLHRNPVLVTALNPIIGYEMAAKIAKQAYKDGRPIIEVALEKTDLSREQLERLLDPRRLTGD
ncbi:class II fumarate hydratase [Porticoccaceae bacterium LTM1]|nr:class II fumarate hydratase [Porticoccaceae bacterium LTM1]